VARRHGKAADANDAGAEAADAGTRPKP
jgi:hypothetical protein